MRTPASIARHPIHPMLVPFPIGLWVFSFPCDLIFMFGGGAPVWKTVALYTMIGGIVGALLAALPGFIVAAFVVHAAAGRCARPRRRPRLCGCLAGRGRRRGA